MQRTGCRGAYKDQTRENGMTTLTKEKIVEYKTNEAASLDKAVSEVARNLF